MSTPDQQGYTFEQVEQLAKVGTFQLDNAGLNQMRQEVKQLQPPVQVTLGYEERYQSPLNYSQKASVKPLQYNQQISNF